MTWNEVFCNTFQELRKRTGADEERKVDFMLPSMPMVEACRADDFDFFLPFIESGDLSIDQMHHAASRYFLGKTRSGQPVFWMIDDMLQPLDAHLGDTWISKLLKDREPLLEYWEVQHCLFGLHLSSDVEKPIAIVESESSAAVLSELLPDSLWMAYATTSHLVPELLAPLAGRTVTIYPRTDPTMSTYLFFLDYANIVRRQYDINIQVDATLEDHATPDQKNRCIDIIDFFLE